MAPALAQFEQENKGKFNMVDLDVDQAKTDPNFQKYGHFKQSNYIPETLILKDGKMVFNKVGVMSVADLNAAVKQAQQ